MTPEPLPEWRIRELCKDIAQEAAEGAVDRMCDRLGLDAKNLGATRPDLDFLRRQRTAADARSQEGRKTVFAVIGGITMALLGALATFFNLRGGPHP